MAIWFSSEEERGARPTLEERVAVALDHPEQITRYGPLSLGESCWLVNSISRLQPQAVRAFHVTHKGQLALPTWVDHDHDNGTRYAIGSIVATDENPPFVKMSSIQAPPGVQQ